MSGKAHRARRDASEAEIIDILKARGYHVRQLAARGMPDLMVWYARVEAPSKCHLIECKTGKGKLRITQDWAALGLHVDVLRSAEEAMRWNR